jgi:signal transduction histidine kinase
MSDASCHNPRMAGRSIPWPNLLRTAAAATVVAAGLGALAVAEGSGRHNSYAGSSIPGAAVTVAAGLALVVAGWATSLSGRGGRTGDLAILAGFLWFAPVWIGWSSGPPLIRSVAMAGVGFEFAVLLHLVVAAPNGRIGSSVARVGVAVVYAEAAIAALALALVRDPYFDLSCWANCSVNSFLVRSLPSVAHGIQVADRWFTVGAGLALAAFCVWRLVGESGPARPVVWPVAAPGAVLGAAVAAHGVAQEFILQESPSSPVYAPIFFVEAMAVILIAGGLGLTTLRARRQRRFVAGIVTGLGDAPTAGSLQAALARALGDPELRIAYRLSDPERYVDSNGKPVPEPTASPGRAVTTLVRAERPVAVVAHTAAFADLERELGAAARLGFENERLQAEVLAQLDELQASRARIVETGDAERRRLERNLHDGAQQRVLALSYDIRLARAAAEADADAAVQTLLDASVAEAQTALQELRQLAHGIFPAILSEAGLEPALETLVDETPIPVDLRGEIQGRLPAPIEMAAYVTVVEALDDAVARGATSAVVESARGDGSLALVVEDDGEPRSASLIHVGDRIGAVGGTLELEPTRLRAVIPCA